MKVGDLVQVNDDIPTIVSENGHVSLEPNTFGLVIRGASEWEPELFSVRIGLGIFHVWEKEMTLVQECP